MVQVRDPSYHDLGSSSYDDFFGAEHARSEFADGPSLPEFSLLGV